MARVANRYALPVALSNHTAFRAGLMSDSEDSEVDEEAAPKPEPVNPDEVELIPEVALDSQHNSVAIWWLLQKARALSNDIFMEDCLEACKRGGWKISLLGSQLEAGANVRLHGFAVFRIESAKKRLALRKIAVPEADRRHGFGRKLMDWVLNFAAQSKDVNRVALSSLASSLPFYERLGFHKVGKAKAADEPDDILFPGQVLMELSVRRDQKPEGQAVKLRFPKPSAVEGMKSKKRVFIAVATDKEAAMTAAEDTAKDAFANLGLRRSDRLVLVGLNNVKAEKLFSTLDSGNEEEFQLWRAKGVSVAALSSRSSLSDLGKAATAAPHAIVVSAKFLLSCPAAAAAVSDFEGAVLVIEDAELGQLQQKLRLEARWQWSDKGFCRASK